jgi:hypothetical protein
MDNNKKDDKQKRLDVLAQAATMMLDALTAISCCNTDESTRRFALTSLSELKDFLKKENEKLNG